MEAPAHTFPEYDSKATPGMSLRESFVSELPTGQAWDCETEEVYVFRRSFVVLPSITGHNEV